jgi:hypothetical protein
MFAARLPFIAVLFSLATAGAVAQKGCQDPWVAYEDSVTGLFGFKDLHGNITVSPRYWDVPTDTFRTIAFVGVPDSGWVCIDRKLNALFRPYIWDNGIDFFQSGLIRIQQGGKIGFADMEGRISIPPVYDYVLPFDGNHTAFYGGGRRVCLDKGVPDSLCEHMGWTGGRWGIIDKSIDTLIEPSIEDADISDLSISSLTDNKPSSTSFIPIEGKTRTYYLENIRRSFDEFFRVFLKEVERRNFVFFKSVCHPVVKCTYCLLNTKREYDRLVRKKLYIPGDFYTETPEKEILPAGTFIRNDFDLVFSRQAIDGLLDTTRTAVFVDFEYVHYLFPFEHNGAFLQGLDSQRRYYKITAMLTHYRGKDISYQEHFEFLKTDEGFRFTTYDRTLDGYGQ